MVDRETTHGLLQIVYAGDVIGLNTVELEETVGQNDERALSLLRVLEWI